MDALWPELGVKSSLHCRAQCPGNAGALCYSPEIHRTSCLGVGQCLREAPSSPGWGVMASTGPSWLETGHRRSPRRQRDAWGHPASSSYAPAPVPVCLSVSWLHVVRAAGRATSGSLGVRRGCPACWGGLQGKRGAFPKSASKLKQAGLQLAAARGLSWKDWPGQPRQRRDRWQGRHPRSHGVAQPSIVVSGTRSLPGTCWPQSHTVSTCQALPIRHLQQMNLPPGTTATPPPNPRATSRTPAQLCLFLQAFSQHRHGSALSPSQRDLPSLATHTPPSQPRPPKLHQHPPILHQLSTQQQPPSTCHTPSLPPNPSPTRDRTPDPSSASPQLPPLIPVENRMWRTSRWGAGKEQGSSAGQKEDEDEDGERRAGHGF